MKISLINGSQKTGESSSGIILDRLHDLIAAKAHEVKIYKSGIQFFDTKTLKDIISGEIIVLAFPLYVDSIPSHTLKILMELEKAIKTEQSKNIMAYAIVNNGFYEGQQNHLALEMVKHWCEHCGISFGGGIGQGAGGMVESVKGKPFNKGPFGNLERALQSLVKKIELKENYGIQYLNPNFPRFLYNMLGNKMWRETAYKNGLNKKDILTRL